MSRVKIKLIALMLGMLILTACQNKTLLISGQAQSAESVIKQWIEIEQAESKWNWVCITELNDYVISGFSCQNDTAMPLFSGGLVGGVFKYEYISKLILKIAPERMLSYIKVALYEPGGFEKPSTANRFKVSKNKNSTLITDIKNKLNIRLTTL